MPVYAYLQTDLARPFCKGTVIDMVMFLWGVLSQPKCSAG